MYKTIDHKYNWNPKENKFEEAPVGIVVHCMAETLAGKEAPDWLANDRGLSAHGFVWDNGDFEQGQPITREAWHAGVSKWRGMEDLNELFLGIEMLVPMSAITDTGDPYHDFLDTVKNKSWVSPAAMETLFQVLRYWCKQYPSIELENITMHSQVSGPAVRGSKAKHDPGNLFPWTELIHRLRVELEN